MNQKVVGCESGIKYLLFFRIHEMITISYVHSLLLIFCAKNRRKRTRKGKVTTLFRQRNDLFSFLCISFCIKYQLMDRKILYIFYSTLLLSIKRADKYIQSTMEKCVFSTPPLPFHFGIWLCAAIEIPSTLSCVNVCVLVNCSSSMTTFSRKWNAQKSIT